MPTDGDKSGDGTRTYGTCWVCGTKGWLRIFLGGKLLCHACNERFKRADPCKVGNVIRENLAAMMAKTR